MNLRADFREYQLRFISPMGTSRGPLLTRTIYVISLRDETGAVGLGECAPVPGLSFEKNSGVKKKLVEVCAALNREIPLADMKLSNWPAVRFGFEAAFLDLKNGGRGVYFASDFTTGQKTIEINGLIHMNGVHEMRRQLLQKIEAGFKCIKIKIGSLDFDAEVSFLKDVRELCPAREFELRLDANGAFEKKDALARIDRLARFDVHSLEQPIQPDDLSSLRQICNESPIPIALDESLIGVFDFQKKRQLLETVQPSFVILKPTLLGGFAASLEWIDIASELGIGFWVTSIMESNIGLSALCQWTSTLAADQVQGLGTGRLFDQNFDTGIRLDGAELRFKPDSLTSRAIWDSEFGMIS